jgi:UBA/TS-N domain
MQSKVQHLSEMGFSRAAVAEALQSTGGNEEAALSILLSSDSSTPSVAAPALAPGYYQSSQRIPPGSTSGTGVGAHTDSSYGSYPGAPMPNVSSQQYQQPAPYSQPSYPQPPYQQPPYQQSMHQQPQQQQQQQQQQPPSYSQYGASAAPGYHSQSPPVAGQPPHGGADFEAKVQRLCEMGFNSALVRATLTACNGNEEAALSAMLGGDQSAATTTAQAPPQQQQPPASKPSGLLSKLWGSKK